MLGLVGESRLLSLSSISTSCIKHMNMFIRTKQHQKNSNIQPSLHYIRWRRGRVSDLRPEVVGSSLSGALRHKNSGQVSHTCVPLSPSSITWYQRKLGSKQTRCAIHYLAERYRKRRLAPPHGPMWLGKDFTFYYITSNNGTPNQQLNTAA